MLCVIAGAIETASKGSPVDIMMGIGGTPEGEHHPLTDLYVSVSRCFGSLAVSNG